MKNYHEIVGDGGSNVLAQVVAQRAKVRENLSQVKWIVAVGSGKGGVGKSTLAFCLAVMLKESGHATAIFDADLNGPTQARLAGLRSVPLLPGTRGLVPPRTSSGIGVVSLGAAVPENEAVEFESVASGDSHVWRSTREFGLVGEFLGSVEWGALDFLVIDLPPGADRTIQYAEYLGPRTAFVLVSIPSDVARGVVSRSVSALRKTPNRVLGYIENMSGYWCSECNHVRPLFGGGTEIALDIPLLATIPFDPALASAGDLGLTVPGGPGNPVREALDHAAIAVRRALETPS